MFTCYILNYINNWNERSVSCWRVYPLVSEAHYGYTSFREYLITIKSFSKVGALIFAPYVQLLWNRPPFSKHFWFKFFFAGEINGAFINDNQSLAGSRKSMNFPSVVMMPHPSSGMGLPPPPPPPMSPPIDAYSDFSPRGRNQMPSPQRNPYATSIQNFQL